MSNNPSITLTAPASTGVPFCLAVNPKLADLICTRIDGHPGHCCDEIVGESWDARGKSASCDRDHDHSAEKGLA
jgi:hypothetical protein